MGAATSLSSRITNPATNVTRITRTTLARPIVLTVSVTVFARLPSQTSRSSDRFRLINPNARHFWSWFSNLRDDFTQIDAHFSTGPILSSAAVLTDSHTVFRL